MLDEADTLFDDTFNSESVPFLGRFRTLSNLSGGGLQISLVGATIPDDLNNILKDLIPAEQLTKVWTNKLPKSLHLESMAIVW